MPRIEAGTALYGVVGWPLESTLSPLLHNSAFTALGIPAVYLPLRVAPRQAAGLIEALETLGLRGANVTVPHKAAAFSQCVRVSPDAQAARSVNTLTRAARGWQGDTTDGEGLVDCLEAVGLEPKKLSAALLGAGGASRSVAVALLRRAGNHVRLITRDPDGAAEALKGVRRLGAGSTLEILPRGGLAARRAIGASGLVLNGTSLGLPRKSGSPGGLPCPAGWVAENAIAVDFVYGRETPWLAALRRRGVPALSGLGMLIHQAARSFRAWTGKDALSWMLWTGGWDEERVRAGLAGKATRKGVKPRA